MRPDALERLAVRCVPGEGPPDIKRVSQGLINETYRVLRDGGHFALRVAAANPYHLGVDRKWEARVIENAVAAGLAPAVVHCDSKQGILITRWTEGRSWSPPDARCAAGIDRIADLMRRIHALAVPAPPRIMSPARWIEFYSGAAPRAATPLRQAAGAQLAALAALPGADPVLCHSDLHIQNLIDRGDSLVLLDWEYAHAADPFWDLAGWSANNDYPPDLQRELLAKYTGRPPTRTECSRLKRLGWLYDYVCLLWSELYLNPQRDAGPHTAAHAQVADRARLLAARLEEIK